MDGAGRRHGGSRRWFLSRTAAGTGLAALGLVAGCGRGERADTAAATTGATGAPGDDEALVDRARATSEQVLATCLGLRRRHPDLLADWDVVLARHRAHVALLTPTDDTDSDTDAGPAPRAEAAPAGTDAARRRLVEAERTASAAHADDAVDAVSGELARVLASVAAAEAQLALTGAGAGAR